MREIVLFTISVHHFCYREAEGRTVTEKARDILTAAASTNKLTFHFFFSIIETV